MSRTAGTNRQRVGDLDEDVTRFLSGGEMDALMSDESFETLEVRYARRLGEIKQLQSENTGLRGQLKAAQQLIKNLSKRGTVSGSNKRLRLGSEPAGVSSALVSDGNGEENEPAYHPAEARADRVQSELDEQKLLREQDRKKLELLLRDAESTNKKLLRQVKFLSEEEEEARAEYGKKQEEFLAEMANMQEALRAERAARATASADGEHLARQERQGLERRVQREVMAREVAEERIAVLERQAKARTAELTDARSEARDAGAEQSRLSRELAALRRDNGVGPTTPLGDQDTPVARELRAKIRVMERKARRMEVTIQELTDDRRNSALLEEKAQSLQAKLQRTEVALENALRNEAEYAATKDEKEQWAMLFSKAIKEERLTASFTKRGGIGDAGDRGREEGQDTQPTPLAALRLLRDIQAEKSVMLEELTSLRLRHKDATERLEQAQALVKEKQGGEESLSIRAEKLQQQLGNLGRRCRTAEQEIEAQKELIESYERDNFRKPSESWLGDFGKMQAALAAAQHEAQSLRQQAESSISEAEASELRTRAEHAETELSALIEQNKAERNLVEAEQEVAGYENRVATGADGGHFKVLHLTHNPERLAWEKDKADLTKQVEAFKEDNKRLVRQLESAGAVSVDVSMSSSMSMVQGGAPDAAKYSQRLKEAFKERINYYREAVYLLTGYKVDLVKDPARQVLRLRSMYAEHEADGLVFHQVDDGLELVETPFVKDHLEKVESYLGKFHSIPAFLSSITLELFEKQTFMPHPY